MDIEEAEKYCNLIKERDLWNAGYVYGKEAIETVLSELKKKDKIIDEMAEYLSIIRDCPNKDKGANLDCENRCSNDDKIYAECWKMYFERKVEVEIAC